MTSEPTNALEGFNFMVSKPQTIAFSLVPLTCAITFFLASCAEDIVKPAIGTGLASPIDIAATDSGSHFLVLNSDFNNSHDTGSILVMDREGNKISSVTTPRLGRSLTLVGSDLLVTYDKQGAKDEDPSYVELYNVSQTGSEAPSLTLQKTWTLTQCVPVKAEARKNYPYFAVSCQGGRLMVGELKDTRNASTLDLVRNYGDFTRRAMHIDPVRGLLFAFVTDLGAPNFDDGKYNDSHTYNMISGEKIENTPDDAPDVFLDDSRSRRSIREGSSRFIYIVYDLSKEAAEREADGKFKFKTWQEDPNDLQREVRWLSFNLSNFDGSPDDPLGYTESNARKYYRTNFWQARPDPNDANSFFLSHRGRGEIGRGEHSNSIVKVTIKGDPRAYGDGDSVQKPLTADVFDFKRVFGFKGAQTAQYTYLGDFAITNLDGHDAVVVNSFHDLVNFDKQRYGLLASTLDDPEYWNTSLSSSEIGASYYQFAIGSAGRMLASSFYDNSVILLDLSLGAQITTVKKIQ